MNPCHTTKANALLPNPVLFLPFRHVTVLLVNAQVGTLGSGFTQNTTADVIYTNSHSQPDEAKANK
jgi:hypothetical protein